MRRLAGPVACPPPRPAPLWPRRPMLPSGRAARTRVPAEDLGSVGPRGRTCRLNNLRHIGSPSAPPISCRPVMPSPAPDEALDPSLRWRARRLLQNWATEQGPGATIGRETDLNRTPSSRFGAEVPPIDGQWAVFRLSVSPQGPRCRSTIIPIDLDGAGAPPAKFIG
jgi:hypothetical protein